MLAGLQTEINAHPEWATAGKKLIIKKLNEIGSANVEDWVVNETEIKTPKGDILALLSAASISKVITWARAEADDNALAFHEFYLAHDTFTVTHPTFRSFIGLLYTLEQITEAEKNAVLRLGERQKSRAEELFSRFVTVEDFD